ncbi:MAG: PhzF family phenazine biosynthesis protein [Candidatus Krumholzibacteriota bacterium]|nr:PhzF family phenazine biosynthesis protein [Candidatus Krumholzibacteriota bacterium]
MQKIKMKQVDAFTTKPFSGNQAGIILDADGLTLEEQKKVASEINLSESAFITHPQSAEAMFRIRYLTATSEMDISGHTTVAACFALIEEGKIQLNDGLTRIYLETNIGNIPIDIHFQADPAAKKSGAGEDRVYLNVNGNPGYLYKIMTHQSIHKYRAADVPIKAIAEILEIDESEIAGTGLPMEIIDTGLTQFVVPLLHRETLLSMHPDLIKLGLLNQKFGIETNDIFTIDTCTPEATAYSRHFSPVLGTWENPASGNGAATVGTYLIRHGVVTTANMTMEQGNDIDSLAKVYLIAEEGFGESVPVQLGGLAVTSIERTMQINRETNEVVMLK